MSTLRSRSRTRRRARSRYEQQLQRLEALFPAEQLLLLRSEDLFAQPERVWGQVLTFLELEALPLPPLAQPANAGQGEAAKVPARLRQALREQLQATYAAMERSYELQW